MILCHGFKKRFWKLSLMQNADMYNTYVEQSFAKGLQDELTNVWAHAIMIHDMNVYCLSWKVFFAWHCTIICDFWIRPSQVLWDQKEI